MTILTDTQIKVRRDEILSEMQSIREMIRGKISFQSLKRTAADGSVKERGPYAVFQRWLAGRNHSQRIPKDELPAITRAVDGYQRFVHLSDEFAALTETLTQRSGPLLPSKKTPGSRFRRKIPRNRNLPQRRPSKNNGGRNRRCPGAGGRPAKGAAP